VFETMASLRWCFGLIRRKEARFIVLLLRLGLVEFNRVSRISTVRVRVRVSGRIRARFSLCGRIWNG